MTKSIWIWQTANDQHVCDACAPLKGQLVRSRSPHPRCSSPLGCRCWTSWIPIEYVGKRMVYPSGISVKREVMVVE